MRTPYSIHHNGCLIYLSLSVAVPSISAYQWLPHLSQPISGYPSISVPTSVYQWRAHLSLSLSVAAILYSRGDGRMLAGHFRLGSMPPPHVLHSLSLPTCSASTMQAHSLPLTTPSVLPLLPLPPVSGDFLISVNFPPIPAKLVQKIRRWEFVELNQFLPDNLVSFPNQDSELRDQKLP